MDEVYLLDYGAGNVRSVENAIVKCGFKVHTITNPDDILKAKVLVFPGVGSFGNAIKRLQAGNYIEPLKEYIKQDRRFLGICLGMQTLFEGSEEDLQYKGLGVIPGIVKRFDSVAGFDSSLSIPQIGWNSFSRHKGSRLFEKVEEGVDDKRAYFVHSYCAMPSDLNKEWILTTTTYGTEFISAVQKGNVMATQFHPEKSGALGLQILQGFLESTQDPPFVPPPSGVAPQGLSRRIIACLDVRKNDNGDLVVTKGDGYEVREKKNDDKKGEVRNFGKPVEIARRYYVEGADEITFLNITQFREDTLEAQTMHDMLRCVSENVFVPLTIGGGIRDYGNISALEVAEKYFRSGADKVSLGSYAVEAVLKLRNEMNNQPDGTSAIEKISKVYGNQAVVISVDPRRIYLETEEQLQEALSHGYTVFDVVDDRSCADKISYNSWLFTSLGLPDNSADADAASKLGCSVVDETGSKSSTCWFQCTVAGGRQRRPLDAVQLAQGTQALGAGEILLNSIDKDGKNSGFDLPLVNSVRNAISLPVIASSGAGSPQHFVQVFNESKAEAGLAAGIFHREEVSIAQVKEAVFQANLPVRK